MTTKQRNQLKHLLAAWKAQRKKYQDASNFSDHIPPHDRSRYEGIETGYRWCIGDLEEWLKSL